jgi:transcriptional regulator with GAF, ATPase, and Fis domain
LITGERGTGKTTIARKLHKQGARSKREFVNLNCASLTQELLESELFGYEKGAFTGATSPKAGLFEIANGGTLFLDEIGELPLKLQPKLLKAVEEKRIRRVGSSSERTVDARIVAATSQNIKQMVVEGRFRADLYDRLNILNLETVPLRRQKQKIKGLLLNGLNKECSAIGRLSPFELSASAGALRENCDWLGNFRELLNLATRIAVEYADIEVITAAHVRRVMHEPERHLEITRSGKGTTVQELKPEGVVEIQSDNFVTVSFNPALEDLDSIYVKAAGTMIRHVLQQNEGNLRRSARAMGATHSTLSRILKKYHERFSVQDQPLPTHSADRFAAAVK